MANRLIGEAIGRVLGSKTHIFPTFQGHPAARMISFSSMKQAEVVQPEKRSVLAIDSGLVEKKKVGGEFWFNDSAFIRLDSMQSANSSLENFCSSYFMFHGMDVNKPECIFKYLPVLSFTESYLYQLDNWNEETLNVQRSTVSDEEPVVKAFESDPFQPLFLLLEPRKLLTKRIKEELRTGAEYWVLERKLCTALQQGVEIAIEDVMKALHLKSCNFRTLNLLLYHLRGDEVNELHMEFLATSEFLVEIADDMLDYEDDVLNNTFNTLRMFARIYGTSSAPSMLAKCIAEAQEKHENLLKTLDPKLSSGFPKRWEQIMKQVISGQPFGSWTIPHIIEDEQLYRSTRQTST